MTAVSTWASGSGGVKKALLAKLDAALASIQASNGNAACGSMHAFIDLVNAQRSKALSATDADALIAAAVQIRAVIGC